MPLTAGGLGPSIRPVPGVPAMPASCCASCLRWLNTSGFKIAVRACPQLVEPVLRLCQEDSPLLKGSDPGPSSQVLCLEVRSGACFAHMHHLTCRHRGTARDQGHVWAQRGTRCYSSVLEAARKLSGLPT